MISGHCGTGYYVDIAVAAHVIVIIVDDTSASGTGPTVCEFEHSDTSVCYGADLYRMPEEIFIEPECKTYDRPPQKIKARSANTKSFLKILKQPMAKMGFKRGQRSKP